MPNFFGAMETWGIIIYDEPILIYQDDWFDSNNLRSTGTIIAHELAHFVSANIQIVQHYIEH